jgi:hypothetical protein
MGAIASKNERSRSGQTSKAALFSRVMPHTLAESDHSLLRIEEADIHRATGFSNAETKQS